MKVLPFLLLVTVTVVLTGFCTVGYAEKIVTINSSNDFVSFAKSFSTGDANDEYVLELKKDITLSPIAFPCPIGTPGCYNQGDQGKSFKGVFHGNHHKISGVDMKNRDNVGLFWDVSDATFDNLILSGCRFSGSISGALASTVSGHLKVNNVKSNCTVSGSKSVGGLIGLVNTADSSIKIARSEVSGSVSFRDSGSVSTAYTGGFIGRIYGNKINMNIEISESRTYDLMIKGSENSSVMNRLGGFIGEILDESNSTETSLTLNMTKCTNWITINANQGTISGMIGTVNVSSQTVNFDHCYNAGDITLEGGEKEESNNLVGGLIGKVSGTNIEYKINYTQNSGYCNGKRAIAVGGFIGMMNGMKKSNISLYGCRNGGNIDSSNYSGGFIGKADGMGSVSIELTENAGDVNGNFSCGFACCPSTWTTLYVCINNGNVDGLRNNAYAMVISANWGMFLFNMGKINGYVCGASDSILCQLCDGINCHFTNFQELKNNIIQVIVSNFTAGLWASGLHIQRKVDFVGKEESLWVSPNDPLDNYKNFLPWSMDDFVPFQMDYTVLLLMKNKLVSQICEILNINLMAMRRSYRLLPYDTHSSKTVDMTLGLFCNVTVIISVPVDGPFSKVHSVYYVRPGTPLANAGVLSFCSKHEIACSVSNKRLSNDAVVSGNMVVDMYIDNATILVYEYDNAENQTEEEVDDEVYSILSDNPDLIAVEVTSQDPSTYTIIVYVTDDSVDSINAIMTSCMGSSSSVVPDVSSSANISSSESNSTA